MQVMEKLDAWGFDPTRVSFALRTAFAACVALWLAQAIGLQHPQWAAMSVWAAAQPLRGQLLEKSFFRLMGTIVGTAVGIGLALAGEAHLLLLVMGLALWVGLCTAIASVWRGYLSYGAVLAGYSAAMVALLDIGHPENLGALGLDRLATVLLGVAVVTLLGLPFAPKGAVRRGPTLALMTETFGLMAKPALPDTERAAALARLAAAEEGLDPQAAGSAQERQRAHTLRLALLALTGALLAHREGQSRPWDAAAQSAGAGDWTGAARLLDAAGEAPLAEALRGIAAGSTTPAPALHRDWIGAAEGGLRAALGLALVGVVWVVTGFSGGNFMLLGLAVMISVFSTLESPATFMRWVVMGQIIGIAAMLVLRWGIWPLLPSGDWLVPAMFPFIFMGAALTAHRKTVFMSLDANMCFLLLLHPVWPLEGSLVQSLTLAGGVLAAPLLAWLMYRVVFPANLPRRVATLEKMMRQDLVGMAQSHPDADALAKWHSRLHHRVMRLMRMGEKIGRDKDVAFALGLAHLRVGTEVLTLHATATDTGRSAAERQAAAEALRTIATAPEQAIAAASR